MSPLRSAVLVMTLSMPPTAPEPFRKLDRPPVPPRARRFSGPPGGRRRRSENLLGTAGAADLDGLAVNHGDAGRRFHEDHGQSQPGWLARPWRPAAGTGSVGSASSSAGQPSRRTRRRSSGPEPKENAYRHSRHADCPPSTEQRCPCARRTPLSAGRPRRRPGRAPGRPRPRSARVLRRRCARASARDRPHCGCPGRSAPRWAARSRLCP